MSHVQLAYKLQDAAKMLDVSIETLRRMLRSGQLPAFKVRNSWRISAENLRKFTQTAVDPAGTK